MVEIVEIVEIVREIPPIFETKSLTFLLSQAHQPKQSFEVINVTLDGSKQINLNGLGKEKNGNNKV